MQRFLLTCAIGLGLWSALLVYSQVMTPLTRALEKPKQPPKMDALGSQSMALDPAVEKSLADQEWIKTAALQISRSQQMFLYAGQVEPDRNSNGSTLKMAPFAMIWKDEKQPDRPPMTVVARSARIRFEKPLFDSQRPDEGAEVSSFNFAGQDAGRIVAAALDGEVRITGPDNLVIDGRDFIFSEETAQLYSDYEISFRYGPPEKGEPVALRGKSLDGLTITFNPASSSPLGADMPRVEELPKSAQLRGRVSVDFVTQEEGQATRTRVTSQGPFTYEFEINTAKFSDRVQVTRPRPKRHLQELECNWLALVFAKVAQEPSDGGVIPAAAQEAKDRPSGLLSGVELLTVRARARTTPNSPQREKLKLVSSEHGLVCELDDLTYDAQRQILTLTDPQRVEVTRDWDGHRQKLEAPTIEIRHRDRHLEQFSGIGAGRFTYRVNPSEKGVADVWASWKERLDLIPQPQQNTTELSVRGSATVGNSDQMQFDAATITAWLLPLEQLGKGFDNSTPELPRKVRPPKDSPVRRVVASGNVTFAGPGIVGRRIQQVDVQVVSGPIIPISKPRRRNKDNEPVEQTGASEQEEIPLVFETSRVEGVAVFDPAVNQYAIQELHGFDGVRLWKEGIEPQGTRDIPFEQQPIRVTSREFSALNSGGTRQVLTLRGVVDPKGVIREPVIAKFGDFSIEGPSLVIDREKNLATVEGQGVLRFPVEQDLSGNMLATTEPADIACLEKIEFDGQKATFLGSVKASILSNVLRAEEMTAILNQRIDFSADEPNTRGFVIDNLKGHGKVRVEMYEYNEQKVQVVEILKAQMHEFDLNQKTGEFVGSGPGKIQDWRRAGTRRMLAQASTTSRANRPADTNREYPWEYVGIEFEDKLTGNVKQQWGRLNERVQLIYAPVKNANEIFERDDLSSEENNAVNAVWIGSDQLTVSLTEQSGSSPLATVEALLNAQMEGCQFYSQAHSVRYEQAKEMFTLQGKGRDDATLNVWRDRNSTPSPLTAQVIQFFPSRQEVVIDRAKTFSAVFGGDSSRE